MKNSFSSSHTHHFSHRLHTWRGTLKPTAQLSAADMAYFIQCEHADSIAALRSLSRHPRSLARPLASWRPPVIKLPILEWVPGSKPLRLSLTRYRVGPRARARIKSYGQARQPAYLLSVRLTSSQGTRVPTLVAEAWMRALVDAPYADAIHEITTSSAAMFVWLVDRDFKPVRSPVSLFEDFATTAA